MFEFGNHALGHTLHLMSELMEARMENREALHQLHSTMKAIHQVHANNWLGRRAAILPMAESPKVSRSVHSVRIAWSGRNHYARLQAPRHYPFAFRAEHAGRQRNVDVPTADPGQSVLGRRSGTSTEQGGVPR